MARTKLRRGLALLLVGAFGNLAVGVIWLRWSSPEPGAWWRESHTSIVATTSRGRRSAKLLASDRTTVGFLGLPGDRESIAVIQLHDDAKGRSESWGVTQFASSVNPRSLTMRWADEDRLVIRDGGDGAGIELVLASGASR